MALTTTLILVAVSVLLVPGLGSKRSPDPPSSPHEILEVVVRHALPDPALLDKLAQVDKTHLELVRGILRHQRLRRIVVQPPTSCDRFVRDIKWLIAVCRAQPVVYKAQPILCRAQPIVCRAQPAILSGLLTEETAPLFLYRLLSITLDNPELIADLFNVIGDIESVAVLTPGWVLVVYNFGLSDPGDDDPVMVMCRNLLGKAPTAGSVSIRDIPDAILDTVRCYEGRSSGPLSMRGRLPEPFAAIDPLRSLEVAFVISDVHAPRIRSRPVLARRLFFLGTPIHLDELPIAEFTASDLRALLPYVFYVASALSYQIDDLIRSGRADLIAVILRSEAFFAPAFSHFLFLCLWLSGIVTALVKAADQHDSLRLLLAAPLPQGWVAEVESISGSPILHRAVKAGNADAVRVLLEFPDLIKIDGVDKHGRTARWYAELGSEIDTLLYE